MNACRHIGPELVSYIKDELTPAERDEIKEHLDSCELCRDELTALNRTFDALHKELVPIELSAHFRIALMDRIDEATQASAQQSPKPVRQSKRHLNDMDRPVITRLFDHARRSPYFALSMAVHAVAALIVLGVFIQMNRMGDNNRENVIVHGEDNAQDSNVNDANFMRTAWQTRREAPSFTTMAAAATGGVKLDVTQSMTEDGAVVLVPDRRLDCVVALLADREGRKRSEELLATVPQAVAGTIENATLVIPATMSGDLFTAGDALRVFQFAGRLEVWSDAHWSELSGRFTAGIDATRADVPSHLIAAVLPRRERLS